MSPSDFYTNITDGPAPQYDFCGQRGPVKQEMSQSDSWGASGKGDRGKRRKMGIDIPTREKEEVIEG